MVNFHHGLSFYLLTKTKHITTTRRLILRIVKIAKRQFWLKYLAKIPCVMPVHTKFVNFAGLYSVVFHKILQLYFAIAPILGCSFEL